MKHLRQIHAQLTRTEIAGVALSIFFFACGLALLILPHLPYGAELQTVISNLLPWDYSNTHGFPNQPYQP
jgi:hypothetical protein